MKRIFVALLCAAFTTAGPGCDKKPQQARHAEPPAGEIKDAQAAEDAVEKEPEAPQPPAGPEVIVSKAKPFAYACICRKGPYTEIDKVVGEVVAAMFSGKLEARGPMIGVFYNSPDEAEPGELEWDIGYPVDEDADIKEPFVKKQWTHEKIASAVHTGPYDTTGKTITGIMKWLEAKGYEPLAPVLERYLDPNPKMKKPGELKTEVWVPVKKPAEEK